MEGEGADPLLLIIYMIFIVKRLERIMEWSEGTERNGIE